MNMQKTSSKISIDNMVICTAKHHNRKILSKDLSPVACRVVPSCCVVDTIPMCRHIVA